MECYTAGYWCYFCPSYCVFFNFLFPILSGLYPYPNNIFFTFKIRPQRIFSIDVQQLQGGKFLLNEMVAEVPMETRTSVDNLKLSENVEVSIFLRGGGLIIFLQCKSGINIFKFY
jgi:hypothetical protein